MLSYGLVFLHLAMGFRLAFTISACVQEKNKMGINVQKHREGSKNNYGTILEGHLINSWRFLAHQIRNKVWFCSSVCK